MKNKFNLLSLSAAISVLSSSAFAIPVLNADDNSKINVPAGAEATDWYRSSNASELFVAPPSEGEVFLSHYAPRNESFCEDLSITRVAERNALTTFVMMSDQVNALVIRYGHFQYELDSSGQPVLTDDYKLVRKVDADGNFILTEYGQQFLDAIAATDEAQAKNDLDQTIMSDAKVAFDTASFTRESARDELQTCKEDAEFEDEDWREFCELEYEAYSDARDDYRVASAAYNAARSAFLNSEYQLGRAEKLMDRLEDEEVDAKLKIAEYQNLVDAEKTKLRAMYNELAGMFGGQINMTYRTTWDKTVSDFANANPTKTIRRVDVYNPFLTLATSGSYTAGNPGLQDETGLLWSNLNIANTAIDSDFSELPDGTPGGNVGLRGWNDTFQGSIGVTLANACAMMEGTAGLSGPALMDKYSENFSQYLQPNVNYSFDVQAKFGWDAEVNKADVLRRIEKISKKKGFFSSKSKHSIEQEYDQLSSFKIEFVADANVDALSSDEKQELTSIVRSRLTQDVLDQIARRVPSDQSQPDMVSVENPGSTELAQKLRATCKYGWGYGCIGGWGLYAIGGIIGNRTTQMSEYIEKNDFRAYESVRDNFFVTIDRGITFTNK